MVRITEAIKQKMILMRKQGRTYPEICESLGVTKERCIAYLKEIKPDAGLENAMTKEWQEAERQAEIILEKMGFAEIHNLNNLCSFSPSWDLLAKEKQTNRWWLIDVTINGQKSVAAKRDVSVEGYEHAILLKTIKEWKLIRIAMDIKLTLPLETQ